MSDWLKWYLSLCAAVAAMVAAFEAQWFPPVETAYPAPMVEIVSPAASVPQWIDGCGQWHYEPMPPNVPPMCVGGYPAP